MVANESYSAPGQNFSSQPLSSDAPVPVAPPSGLSQSAIGVHQSRSFPTKNILVVAIATLLLITIGFGIYKFIFGGALKTKEVTITWWNLWEDESIIAPLIEEYQSSHPGVKINYSKQSKEDYRERLTNTLARGEGPDIFVFHNTWVPMFENDLDPMSASFASVADFTQTYYRVISSDLIKGSAALGVPLGIDGLGLYINDDIFASYGKTPPTTWDELRQTALSLTKIVNDRIEVAGVAMGRTENVDHWEEIIALMMLQNGVDLSNPTGKFARDALEYFSFFSTVDKVWDATLPPSTQAFAGGKLAMMFGPSWRAFEVKAQNPNLKFRIVPVPQLPKEDPSEPDVNYASYWVNGVWSKSKNKEAAWEFLKFISSKESLEKMYQLASQKVERGVGEPYPRVDMASMIEADPIVGAFVKQAPSAKSWYLASRTFDGPTGINSLIGKYFEDAINAVNLGSSSDSALETAAQGVSQVLSQYGLSPMPLQNQ